MTTIARVGLSFFFVAVSAAFLERGTDDLAAPNEHAARRSVVASTVRSHAMAAYEKAPVGFEPVSEVPAPNGAHQTFFARGAGYSFKVAVDRIQIAVPAPSTPRRVPAASSPAGAQRHSNVLTLRHLGINQSAVARTGTILPGKINYLVGRDPAKWRVGVPTYASVTYRAIYPGIDIAYHGNQGHLEHDFLIAPHANAGVIRFSIDGAERLERDGEGNLVAHVGRASFQFHKPVAYQEGDAEGRTGPESSGRHFIESRYVLHSDRQIGFELGAYDRTKPLVIDPVVSYSTYLGGSDADAAASSVSTAVDGFGNVYVASGTFSRDFPTTAGSVQPQFGGSPETCDQAPWTSGVCGDAFVTKLNADGSAILYSTYLGGSASDYAFGLAVDRLGNAYVAGFTDSSDFPTTAGAFQTLFGGRSSAANCNAYCGDGFVAKLDSSGSRLMYSTYLGGERDDYVEQLALDRFGHVYVTGTTNSTTFPTTPGAFQPHPPSDSCPDCQVAFVTKLNETGGQLVYSTFLGGTNGSESSSGIAVDAMGNAYVAGSTDSTDFPATSSAAQGQLSEGACPFGPCADGFVTKIDASGSSLMYSTYLGGSGYETFYSLALDPAGAAYVTGFTTSADLPTTRDALQNHIGGGDCSAYYGTICPDVFVAKVDPRKVGEQSLAYSTYFGGAGEDVGAGIAVRPNGQAVVTGYMFSTPAASDGDAVVMELDRTGSNLLFFELLGGRGFDLIDSAAIDHAGNVYVAGWTASSDFPTTAGAVQPAFGGGNSDVFVVKLRRSPQLPATARQPFAAANTH